ncbi:hypothetical protein ABBQ38_011312 [Trebouxia sp. C0009 RCD-2024]
MFEAFGDHTAVNWESFQMPTPLGYPIQYRHEYRGLLAVPEPSLQPAPLTVLLRSLFLAAKLISLLPDNCTTPPEVENLACGCLTNIADRLSQLAHNQPSSQASHKSPDEALRQRQICKQLVKLLAPMMSHACIPTSRGCMYCQQRAEAAAKALAAVLKHGGVGVSAAVADAFLAGGSEPALMASLQHKLMWFPSALDMLSDMSQTTGIKAVLKQANALEYLSHALRPVPFNDEVDDTLVVKLTHLAEAAAPVAQDQLKEVCMSQMGMIKTAATLMTQILQTRDVPANPRRKPKKSKDRTAADVNLQIIYVAWAALNWVLKPSKGKADSSDCITAVVELLHHLLVCKPAEMDMTQACCLGVPILLRFLSSSSIHDRHSCELVKRVLDILAANPSMVIAYKDDRLWSALDQLMTVALFDENNSLQLRTVSALLLHEATFRHLATKHSARLVHYLAGFDRHLDQPVVNDWPGLLRQLQKVSA